MTKKAISLGTSVDKTCIICYLIESQNPDVKFHLVDEGQFYKPADKHICNNCLDWIHSIRDKCIEQCKKPSNKILEDITFWHDPKNEEKSAIEITKSTTIKV